MYGQPMIQPEEVWYKMSEAAKLINEKGIGRNKLIDFLRWAEVLDRHEEPYQKFVNAGYFKYVIKQREWHRGQDLVPLVSDKGLEFITRLLKKSKVEYLEWREEQKKPRRDWRMI